MAELHPIRTEADYAAAMAAIDGLLRAPDGTPEADRLEVLSILAEAYERAHHPIGPPTPLEAIRFRMDQLGYTQRDLVEVLGSKSHTSEVLRGRRRLTLDMIRKLHAAWGIPAEALIADPPARKPRRAAPPKRRKPSPARPPRSVKGRGTVLAPRSEPGARRHAARDRT